MPYDEVAELKRQIAQLEVQVMTGKCEIGRLQDAVVREKVSRQIERAARSAGTPEYALQDVESRAFEQAAQAGGRWELDKQGRAYQVGPGGISLLSPTGDRLTVEATVREMVGKRETEHLFTGDASPLAAPTAPAGTAATSPATPSGTANPYIRGRENWTEQGRLEASNPALAAKLAAEADAAKNPWAKDSWNLTRQGEIFRRSPATARAMAEQAGVKLPA